MPPETILDTVTAGARVLIVRLRSLGDCVLTTPAIHLLKQHRPDLRIAVQVEDRFAAVYAGNPDIEQVLPERKRDAIAFRPKLTVNLHGGIRSVSLTLASAAPLRAGFTHYRQQWAYNVHIPRAQVILGEERVVHTAEHVASAMFYLGVPRTKIPRAHLCAKCPPERSPYAVVHPMASAALKTWGAANFAAVGRALRDEWKLEPVFIGGPGEDLSPFAEFRTLSGAPLEEVKSLLSAASLFVGNDSGPAHVAAAFGAPVVVLYGSSDPLVWAPWRTESESIVAPNGLAGVSVERVLTAMEALRRRA
jgi:heptosyltransferase-3